MTRRMGLCAALASVAIMAGMGAAVAEEWPDLPVGIKNGIAAQIGDRLIVGLGSAGTESRLDLNDGAAGWQKLASFDDPAPSRPAAAVSGGALYVFMARVRPTPRPRRPSSLTRSIAMTRRRTPGKRWARPPRPDCSRQRHEPGDGRIAIIGG